jgi:hypothetical protein
VADKELTVAFCRALAAVPPPGWDEFVEKAQLHSVWRWSVVHALARTRRGKVLAAMVCDGDDVVALVAARLQGPTRHSPLWVLDVECPGSMSMPGIAMAGDPFGPLPGSEVDWALADATVHAWESAARREFGRRAAAVTYRQGFGDALASLSRGIGMVQPGRPVAVFRNRFTDHESYQATLPARRRQSQRRLARRLHEDSDVVEYFGPVPADFDVAEFHRVAEDTSRRAHGVRFPPRRPWPLALHAAQAALPGAQLLRYADSAGRLLAAGTTFDHPHLPLAGNWAAVDPHHGGRSGLWFANQDRLIRWVIETGRGGYISGKGPIELKQELGLEAVPQWTILRRLSSR